MRHRITGVYSQIHDHLLDLSGVGLDVSELRIEHGDQLNVLANETLKHLVHVGDQGIEIQHLGLKYLLAAEGQKLTGQRGSPVGSLLDLFDILAQRVVVVEVAM